MKKIGKAFLRLVSLAAALFCAALAACAPKASPKAQGGASAASGEPQLAAPPQKVSANVGSIEVSVDPRTELAMIIARLAEFPAYVGHQDGANEKFRNAADEWFAPYKSHEAVETFKRLAETHHIGFNAVPDLALHSKGDFSGLLYEGRGITERLDSRWKKRQIREALECIAKFRRDAGFDAFFEGMRGEYEQRVRQAAQSLEESGIEEWLSLFFGRGEGLELHFVLSFISGNYGCSVRQADGSLLLTPVVYNYKQLDIIAHEYAHGFCNPAVDGNWRALEKLAAKLYGANREAFRANAYTNSRSVMYETLVRACVGEYVLETFTEESFNAFLEREKAQGFAFIEPLSRKVFELRKRGLKFDELLPQLIEYMNETLL